MKIAIIGCGRISTGIGSSLNKNSVPRGWYPYFHFDAIIKNKIKIYSICDYNQNNLEKTKLKYNSFLKNSLFFNDYKSLILNKGFDFLVILTRTDAKEKILDFAIKNGCRNFLVEKPFCLSSIFLVRIFNLKKINQLNFYYGANRRHHPSYIFAKKIIESKKLGVLEEIIFGFNYSTLMWNHPHTLDLLIYFSNSKAKKLYLLLKKIINILIKIL